MDNGSPAVLKWTRSKSRVDAGENTAENLPITGDWMGTLEVNGKRSNFVLHIQE